MCVQRNFKVATGHPIHHFSPDVHSGSFLKLTVRSLRPISFMIGCLENTFLNHDIVNAEL